MSNPWNEALRDQEFLYAIMKLTRCIREITKAIMPLQPYIGIDIMNQLKRAQPSIDHIQALLKEDRMIPLNWSEENLDEEQNRLNKPAKYLS